MSKICLHNEKWPTRRKFHTKFWDVLFYNIAENELELAINEILLVYTQELFILIGFCGKEVSNVGQFYKFSYFSVHHHTKRE